jgi:DNA replication and repair protein RecF
VHLQQLKLANFKNYESLALDLSPRLNCVVGLNGMGKTNLLDAVHLLCLCRGHTGLSDRQLVRRGEAFFRVEGGFVRGEEAPAGAAVTDRVAVKFALGQRKEVERNGHVYPRLADYVGEFPVVMIAPADVSLVQEGSEERRRFLDTTLAQINPDYLYNLMVYNNLLRQRNALLKLFAETRQYDPALLEALDRQMPGPARLIHAHRAAFATGFRPLFQELYAAISGAREEVDLAFSSDQDEAPLEQLLAASAEKDRLLQRTTQGPHRDDLDLFLDGQPVKRYASQGQLKSFLLALRLAQYELLRREKGVAPLLLLDDIFDKLDERRVLQLVGLLIGRRFGQIFITDTQRARMEVIIATFTGDYKMFEVAEGRIADAASGA